MRFCLLFLLLLAVTVFAGCRDRSAPSGATDTETLPLNVETDVPIDPHAVLDRMIIAYKSAISYSDRATVQIIGTMSQPDVEPVPWNCVVAFMRPNLLRLEINEGIFVSDGEDCYAQIRTLPDQVLHFPAPTHWTLETLFQDVHLDSAMALGLPRSVLRFPPQLVLLFANNPLNTFIPRGTRVEWVAQQQIGQVPCDVIQISHTDGNRILWISREDNALLRMDYQPVGLPIPEGFDSIEAIRIDMTDARFDWNFVPETFQMLQPHEAIQVAEFRSDAPGLPTQEEHRRRLKLMSENDSYRLVEQHIGSAVSSGFTLPPKTAPKTFTLSQIWMQPLIGVGAMAFFPDTPPLLLVPCEGNVIVVLNPQGNIEHRISPKELEDAIIMNVQSNFLPGEQKAGVLTLDGTFYLFGESFELLAAHEEIRCFQFIKHHEEELLLLATNGVVCAVDSQGTNRWEHRFEEIPNQISTAVIDEQLRVLVSCSSAADSILILAPDGSAFEPIEMPFGRHVTWFQVVGSTMYTLLENSDTGDVRFVGFDLTGKSQWSRLLPTGEYEVDPVFVSGAGKWLVPSPSGEILVFDLIGNVLDTFSLDVVPTGLLCLESDGETLLIVADGETVSAWKLEK